MQFIAMTALRPLADVETLRRIAAGLAGGGALSGAERGLAAEVLELVARVEEGTARARRATRDGAIRRLDLTRFSHLSGNQAATEIHRGLIAYATTRWRSDRGLAASPYPPDSMRGELFRIMRAVGRPPSRATVLRVVKFTRRYPDKFIVGK